MQVFYNFLSGVGKLLFSELAFTLGPSLTYSIYIAMGPYTVDVAGDLPIQLCWYVQITTYKRTEIKKSVKSL